MSEEKEIKLIPDVPKDQRDATWYNRNKDLGQEIEGNMASKEEFNKHRKVLREQQTKARAKLISDAKKERETKANAKP